jgi:hypothetical protein
MRWMINFLLPLSLLGHHQELIMAVEDVCIKDCKLIREIKGMKSGDIIGTTNLVTRPSGSTIKGNQTGPCITNRSAPPIGPYHWPADTEVQVFFVRDVHAGAAHGVVRSNGVMDHCRPGEWLGS